MKCYPLFLVLCCWEDAAGSVSEHGPFSCLWLTQPSWWTMKMFAFKLKHFEFLLHPHVSEGHSHISLGLLRRWKGHSRGPVVNGVWHSPCAWCSLSLFLASGTHYSWVVLLALMVVGKRPEKSIHEQTTCANRWWKQNLSWKALALCQHGSCCWTFTFAGANTKPSCLHLTVF